MSAAPPGGPLRLFVAVDLPDDVRRALADATSMLKRAGVDEGLRWVRPEGIHVTLKFLGETPSSKIPAITSALENALAGAPAFELRPEGLGTFHGGRNPHFTREHPRESYPNNIRVLWVGVEGETALLAALASKVDEALVPLGLAAEKRPYSAHLTLARVREDADRAVRERLSHGLEPYASKSTMVVGRFDPALAPAFPSFRVERVSLMQSTLQRGGAVYRAMATFPLGT
ncbi:MAG: RNA 2',3'-cyclic phosphodiesterase [Dehalococcoidia bacterium]